MRILLLVMFILLTACSTHVTMMGKQYPPVDPMDVKILFKDRPECSSEELAFITTPLKWNQNAAMNAARSKAAKIGADYLVIETVHTNEFNDASVSAVAYRCGLVDRAAVDTRPR